MNDILAEEKRQIVDFILEHFDSLEWKKVDSDYPIYGYKTMANNVEIEVYAFRSEYHDKGYYISLKIKVGDITESIYTDNDDTDGYNSELFELEKLLCEEGTYKRKINKFKSEIKRLTDASDENAAANKIW